MITHQVETSGFGAVDHSPEEIRELVYAIENQIKQFPQIEISVTHKFSDGLYYREILIPKGCRLAGRLHKQSDMNVVYYGDIDILTEFGFKRVTGQCSFPGKAGIKQVGIAYEDTLWATIHHTHLTDLKEIEAALFEDEDSEFDFITGQVTQEVLPCQP